MKYIIDLSQYNVIKDYGVLKNHCGGVIIRAALRGYSNGTVREDTRFRTHVSGCVKAGLPIGMYFMSQAITEKEAGEEAGYCIKLAKETGINCGYIYHDSEASGAPGNTGRADKLTKSQRTAIHRTFCENVREHGYNSGVYASKAWLQSNLDAKALEGYSIWVAQYNKTCTYKLTKYDMWQYTSTYTIPELGIKVDRSECYIDFGSAKTQIKETNSYTLAQKPVLRLKSKGEEVKELQSLLNKTGAKLKVDGAFGPLTQAEVKAFQKMSGLIVDGIAGKNTWTALLQ